MGLTAAGAEALSAGINFVGNLGGSVAGGLFAANQAKKNRAFQERMYKQQVKDTIDFWNMQNEYNLPSAQLQRLKDAGLNPLLMYGEGGVQNVANSQAQLPSAPHGAQGNPSSFNTRVDMANLALVEAQADDLRASAEEKRQAAKESKQREFGQAIQNEVNWRTRDAQVAMKNKDVEKVNQEIEWLATQDFALTNITSANLANIAQMMEFRQKYYDIDLAKAQNQIWYNIEQIAIGKAHVSNELKEIAVKLYEAQTNRKEVLGKLEVFNAQVREINSRADLNDQEKTNKILDAYNSVLKNELLETVGNENLGSAGALMLLLSGAISGRLNSDQPGIFTH